MLKRLALSTAGFALALATSATISVVTPSALAASNSHKNCTAKSHRHAKAATKVAATKPVKRGAGGAQIRRTPDIQILTFGP